MSNFYRGTLAGVIRNVEAARRRERTGARKGVRLALLNILNVSNQHIPHEDGDLERDGNTSMADDRLVGAVSYGHDRLNGIKALVNHEDMTRRHDPGRNAKFLEQAMNATRDQSRQIVAQSVRGEMGT